MHTTTKHTYPPGERRRAWQSGSAHSAQRDEPHTSRPRTRSGHDLRSTSVARASRRPAASPDIHLWAQARADLRLQSLIGDSSRKSVREANIHAHRSDSNCGAPFAGPSRLGKHSGAQLARCSLGIAAGRTIEQRVLMSWASGFRAGRCSRRLKRFESGARGHRLRREWRVCSGTGGGLGLRLHATLLLERKSQLGGRA